MTLPLLFYVLLSTIITYPTSQTEAPTVRWGQNSNKLTLIVLIPSVLEEVVKFTENNIYLSATNKKGENFKLNLHLLRPIIPEESTYSSLERGLKLKIRKKTKEPCWKRLTKENRKENFLIKDKNLSDPNDCEEAKDAWLGDYMFYKRKNKPKKTDDPTKKKDVLQNIIESLKDAHPNFSLHEY
ncbi:conserved Plasmodium protein, unknown function [Plasmodium malariae]|uniref:CS domain-containing protein n=1 Tax=Plasmodium malariae TaxID=5858 RepID=A0A1D3TFP9_PLAMA|nr:conserved Plasmodium protein, unknown function [Plasmodium malariae]SCP03781.1 conserved Plasmodium protein, unknown function [Plasmodium malariae]